MTLALAFYLVLKEALNPPDEVLALPNSHLGENTHLEKILCRVSLEGAG